MTSSSENKFYCADVWSNMSVCLSVFTYFIYLSIHPPTYLHIHSYLHPSVRSHDEKQKAKLRMLGKSNMRTSYRVICGVEVTRQKLRKSVKRRFEFRSLSQNHFSTYRPNIVHIVLNNVIYEILMITLFLNLTTCILIEICRRLWGIFRHRLQGVLKKETARPSERRQLSSRLYAVHLRRR